MDGHIILNDFRWVHSDAILLNYFQYYNVLLWLRIKVKFSWGKSSNYGHICPSYIVGVPIWTIFMCGPVFKSYFLYCKLTINIVGYNNLNDLCYYVLNDNYQTHLGGWTEDNLRQHRVTLNSIS